jgi:hypothetical protein
MKSVFDGVNDLMKKRTRESIENLLLALPCALQTSDVLTEQDRAAGWRIFDRLLRQYIDGKRKKSSRRRA